MSESVDDLVPRIHACALYDTGRTLVLYMRYLQLLAGADRISWAALYRGEFGRDLWQYELLRGWKIMDTIDSEPRAHTLALDDRIGRFMDTAKDKGIPPVVEYALDTTGRNRVAWRGACADQGDDWQAELLLTHDGIQDRLFAIASVAPDSECWFTLSQVEGSPSFSADNVVALEKAIDAFPRLHYCLMLERGLLTDTRPLSPREREVLNLLLKSLATKQIAAEVGVTELTARNYVNEIYAKMGVRTRGELLRRWFDEVKPGTS